MSGLMTELPIQWGIFKSEPSDTNYPVCQTTFPCIILCVLLYWLPVKMVQNNIDTFDLWGKVILYKVLNCAQYYWFLLSNISPLMLFWDYCVPLIAPTEVSLSDSTSKLWVFLQCYKYIYICIMKFHYLLLLLLLGRPLCPDGMLIVGQWCSTPCTEAKETLDSIP